MTGLKDFIGCWQLTRQIEDRFAGQSGRLTGKAEFQPDGQGLVLIETGVLHYGDAPPMQADRRYLWREDGREIAVYFEDGNPFHRFSLQRPNDHHPCADDSYAVTYEFGEWPVWRSSWTVTGPRKDYVMESCYKK